jgi:hypothetical protein
MIMPGTLPSNSQQKGDNRIMFKKIIAAAIALVLIASVGTSIFMLMGSNSLIKPKSLTVMQTPGQTKAETPPQFATKSAVVPNAPVGTNLALNKPVTVSNFNDVYLAKNVTDGKSTTYWEAKAKTYPNTLMVNLGSVSTVSAIRLELNPATIWASRAQTFSINISNDGSTFTEVKASAVYAFDPATGNLVDIKLSSPVQAQYVQLSFTANTGAGGGQAAGFDIYGPGK